MRYLVVIDHTLGGTGLSWAVREHAFEEGPIDVDIVVPAEATDSAAAKDRLERELAQLRTASITATGHVAQADAFEATRAAAAQQQYDGVLIASHAPAISRWVHLDLPRRVERDLQIPVEWVEARTDDPAEETTIRIELPRDARLAIRQLPVEDLE